MGITTEFKTQTDSNFELIFSWLGKQLDVLVCLYSVATERPFFGMKKGIFRHPCFVSKTDATEHLKTKLPYVNSERNQGPLLQSRPRNSFTLPCGRSQIMIQLQPRTYSFNTDSHDDAQEAVVISCCQHNR